MADHQDNEKWFEGKSSLFKSRAERVKADIARRKAGRKAIKGEDVKVEWEEQNGVWMGPLVSQELGFQNRIIEVDCHIYPPQSHSVTHKHNEAPHMIFAASGASSPGPSPSSLRITTRLKIAALTPAISMNAILKMKGHW